MTKFLTYYNLCPIPEPKEFLGISPDKDEGNIITTLAKNIIIIIKISTQKQIRSWSVLEKLSSKVVYDRKTEKYVGVFANKFIRCWDVGTADVSKCKKFKFQKSIAELVSDQGETLVLYSDGSCEPLDEAIKSRHNDIGTYSAQHLESFLNLVFSNASVHHFANGNRVLTYFERNIKTDDYHLVRLPLQGEKDEVRRYKLKRGVLDVNVAGAAVIEGDGTPVLLTIWSDKRIFLLNLADDIEPERSPGSFVSMLTQLKVDTPLSVLGLSKHFVAIYGANHGQEGASLLLYNTQYKVIKTKQFFKVYFSFSHLWSVDEHILLAMGQNLSVVKYRVLKEVLSDLVGTQIGHDYQPVVDDTHINEEDCLEECLQYSAEIDPRAPNENCFTNPIPYHYKAADGNYVAFLNSKNFDKELNALRQLNLHVDVVPAAESLDGDQVLLMSNYNDCGFVCPEIQVIANQLEKAGASEHEITEKLLTVLIKANLLQDIGVCLRRYNNISEKILSKTLNYLLINLNTLDETESAIPLTNGVDKEHMEVDCELEEEEEGDKNAQPFPDIDLLIEKYPRLNSPTEVKDILNILLSCSFDAKAIIVHIRKYIKYPQILLILKHLLNMLERPHMPLLEERPALNYSSSDYELQLLRWFGVFLNSHFQTLALSKDEELMEILFKWHQLFQSYKQEIFELQGLAALLYNIVDGKHKLKKKASTNWYSIEEVCLF